MRKLILLAICLMVFLSLPIFPAQVLAAQLELAPANAQGLPSKFFDLFFPGLDWSLVDGSASLDFVTDGNAETVKTLGTTYRSNAFEGKPSAELFSFYYLNRMQSLGWRFVKFVDSDYLMEIQYYNPELERGLDIKMGRCGLFGSSNTLPNQFCAELWLSSNPILPSPKTRPLSETEIPAHHITPATIGSSAFPNPLPVPFYSQRASDPTGSITMGYGKCNFTLYDLGCTVAAYAMIYDYYQAGFTDPVRLNESLKVAPGVFSLYQSGCYIFWPDDLDLPDAPAGVSGSTRVYNACSSPNCLDESNLTLIDTELKLGHPIHARVHWEGEDENHHSVVIIGRAGSEIYIRDPLALDSSPRTLLTGVEGEYIVDYLIPTHGKPAAETNISISPSDRINETLFYIKKYSPNRNIFPE